MVRRVLFAAFVIASALAVAAPAPAHASARIGATSLPPAHPTKFSAQAVAEAPYPYADTFKLHSVPGAQRVVYLDFNGDTISGTGWNDEFNGGANVNAPAYDVDGNTASFSNYELELIQAAWQRVAEDFAPFVVDITTEDPGLAAIERTNLSDQVFGTRVLITNTDFIFEDCGCAGVGFIGVFDAPAPYHQYYQPALIFGQAIGPYDKDLGDSISHEVGHNLGLDHDGKGLDDDYYTGHAAWAPIMGAGYYRPITQWSKGEYTGASNTQDDLAMMQEFGAPLRADDHSNTTLAATPLVGGAAGIISTDADVDVFSFISTGGSVSINASPAPKSPNLDIKLELLDVNGNVVTSDDPPSSQPSIQNPDSVTGLSAAIAASPPPGAYFVRVQGVGAGDPATTGYSGYGSLGRYTLTASLPTLPTLSINDVVVSEGQTGLTPFDLTASLSAPSPLPVTFLATTIQGSALSATDFVSVSNALVTIPAGETSVAVPMQAKGDTTPEPNEKFSVWLASPVGALLGDSKGFAYIANDDIGISIDSVTKYEGAAGTNTVYTFTVSLSSLSTSTIGVTASTVNWTAVAPGDYSAKSVVMSFAPGQKTKTITVVVRGDATKENGEKFFVNLTNPTGPGAVVTSALGTGLIKNDDF